VKLTAGIARDNQLESLGKCAAKRSAVAREGGDVSVGDLPSIAVFHLSKAAGNSSSLIC